MDKFKYTMPIFGQLIYALDFSRFMRAVLLNVENGLRIQDALDVNLSEDLKYDLICPLTLYQQIG